MRLALFPMVTMSKKTKNIIIRVSEEEKRHLQDIAKKCGVSTSEFIRRSVIHKNPNFLSPEDRKELQDLKLRLIEAVRIGNLYHDLRKSNSGLVSKAKAFIKILNKKK